MPFFALGSRRHHEKTRIELLLRAYEEPEPPEWLLGEWASGSVSLQHSGFPMASPSPSATPTITHYPHLFSGLCVVLGWPWGPHFSLSLKLALRYPTSPYDLNVPSLNLGFDLFPFLILCASSLVPSCLLKVSLIWASSFTRKNSATEDQRPLH